MLSLNIEILDDINHYLFPRDVEIIIEKNSSTLIITDKIKLKQNNPVNHNKFYFEDGYYYCDEAIFKKILFPTFHLDKHKIIIDAELTTKYYNVPFMPQHEYKQKLQICRDKFGELLLNNNDTTGYINITLFGEIFNIPFKILHAKITNHILHLSYDTNSDVSQNNKLSNLVLDLDICNLNQILNIPYHCHDSIKYVLNEIINYLKYSQINNQKELHQILTNIMSNDFETYCLVSEILYDNQFENYWDSSDKEHFILFLCKYRNNGFADLEQQLYNIHDYYKSLNFMDFNHHSNFYDKYNKKPMNTYNGDKWNYISKNHKFKDHISPFQILVRDKADFLDKLYENTFCSYLQKSFIHLIESWNNIVVAGDMIFDSLNCYPDQDQEILLDSTIDIYFYGSNNDQNLAFNGLLNQVKKTYRNIKYYHITKRIVEIDIVTCRKVRLILTNNSTIHEILESFDLDCVKIGYNGKEVIGTLGFLFTIKFWYNNVHKNYTKDQTFYLTEKMMERGMRFDMDIDTFQYYQQIIKTSISLEKLFNIDNNGSDNYSDIRELEEYYEKNIITNYNYTPLKYRPYFEIFEKYVEEYLEDDNENEYMEEYNDNYSDSCDDNCDDNYGCENEYNDNVYSEWVAYDIGDGTYGKDIQSWCSEIYIVKGNFRNMQRILLINNWEDNDQKFRSKFEQFSKKYDIKMKKYRDSLILYNVETLNFTKFKNFGGYMIFEYITYYGGHHPEDFKYNFRVIVLE